MKKLLGTLLISIIVLGLMGCPDVTTLPLQVEATPMAEMLFDLPDDAYIVSESFHFELKESTSYLPNLEASGTYVIQNDGETETFHMLYPILNQSTLYDIRMLSSRLNINVNHLSEQHRWSISNTSFSDVDPSQITYDYFAQDLLTDSINPDLITVHAYTFFCPRRGTDETMTLSIPEGTFVLYGYYMEKQETEGGIAYHNVQGRFFDYQGETTQIPSFDKETYLTLYSINHAVEFDANYDFDGTHEEQGLNDLFMQPTDSQIQTQFLAYFIESQKQKDIYSMHLDDYLFSSNHYVVQPHSMFSLSLSLAGNGAQTTIEVDFPPLEFGTSIDGNTRYLSYDFYLDAQRYNQKDIPVTFSLASFYAVESNSYGIDEAVVVNDFDQGTIINLVFTTSIDNQSNTE